MLLSTNPRDGSVVTTEILPTSDAELESLLVQATNSGPVFAGLGREKRSLILEAIADSLEDRRELLVQIADQETGLGIARLNGELSRSIFQFRLFAEAVREGSYLEAIIDKGTETVLGSAPDVRRILVAIGPVAVFGSSNFPFAFSVAGGDTASALAAGCPVVLKAHPSHPLTSKHSFDALIAGLAKNDAPLGTIGLVFGQESGSRLVASPLVKAVSFTGSLSGAKALLKIINSRDEPIPFYGELGSVNPLVVTAGAAQQRCSQIAQELFKSFTGSGGQLCTKPGIALIPTGVAGDKLVQEITALVSKAEGQVLLNRPIYDAFREISERLVDQGGATILVRSNVTSTSSGFFVAPTLLTTNATELSKALADECFGPLLVVVRYGSHVELIDSINWLPCSLTATIHSETDELPLTEELTMLLASKSGRIIYNGFPTGVRVSWAQNHGGPWPATNSIHSSVGVTSMRRFLRPLAWQNAPQSILPKELRDDEADIPRRIDGQLVLPSPPKQ